MVTKYRSNVFLILIFLQNIVMTDVFCVCSNPPPESENVDYAGQVGPIKDQDTIGWCYAFSSADLLNQYLYLKKDAKHGTNSDETISPISLALLYNQHKSNSSYQCANSLKTSSTSSKKTKHFVEESGTACETLMIGLSQKVCLEKKMRSADYSYIDGLNCDVDKKCTLEKLVDQLGNSSLGEFTCNDLGAALALVPSLLPQTAWDILQSSNRKNILNKLRDINCDFSAKQTVPPTPKSLSIAIQDSKYDDSVGRFLLEQKNDPLFNQMDAKLKEGKVVSISYFSDFLQYAKPKHKKDASNAPSSDPNEQNGTHASTIVGKFFNTKTCEIEYKLKNSWGPGCKTYMSQSIMDNERCTAEAKARKFLDGTSVECMGLLSDIAASDTKGCEKFLFSESDRAKLIQKCDEQYKNKMVNPKLRCEEPGYVFIPRSELAKHMYSINYLDY